VKPIELSGSKEEKINELETVRTKISDTYIEA
jgi:hypothetical protein